MDINELLIEEIRQNECLFNLASSDYKNVYKKMEIWEAVAQSVNMSADACRKRWKGLRDTYKKRKRSELLASGSGAPNPSKKWKYMELLSFLDDYADSRPTVGNIEPEILFEDLADCSTSTIVDADASVPSLNQRKETKKKADAEVTSVFKDVMQECSDAIKELTSVTNPPEKVRNTTSLLFESLANRISEAKLPQGDVCNIECKVAAVVYDELKKAGLQ